MTKLDTIQNLAILGGLGAIISPPLSLVFSSPLVLNYWLYTVYSFYGLPIMFFILSILTGILACAMTLQATSYIFKMPQRATSDLKAAGILVVIVGIIALPNLPYIISGMLILVAGIQCDDVWRKIQQARSKTGWPFVTVTTATGSSWARRTSCRFCGAPLIIFTAAPSGHSVRLETQCPLDHTHDILRLPLAHLDVWSSIVADRLHRCQQCGGRTVALIVIDQIGGSSRLQAYCPLGHRNQTYRRIWTPLYPHVARIPPMDTGLEGPLDQPQFRSRSFTPQQNALTQPIIISSSPQLVSQTGLIKYCSQCGVRIEVNDNFCFRCGNQIR